ncbi:MAG: hypothetical protein H7Y00_15840 [Fimbriimonadaceae bacterium]|nr:hypothetical protein [Chitinophagales bacterium]
MKKVAFFLYFVLAILSITSCGAGKDNDSAETTMAAFYDALKQGDVDKALNNCSADAFTAESREEWKSFIENNLGLLGTLNSYKKESGWNINKSTETGTTITMKYDVAYEYGNTTDSITLVKDDDDVMRIFSYYRTPKSAKYIDNTTQAQNVTATYMEAIAVKNYEAAVSLCNEKALAITPKETWIEMLSSTAMHTGEMSGYTIDEAKSSCNVGTEGGVGFGNYYTIYALSAVANGEVKETISLYQEKYDDPLKIIAHSRE